MTSKKIFPYISLEIVEAIENLFKDQCPMPAMTDREVWISVGTVRVAKFLRHMYNEQQG